MTQHITKQQWNELNKKEQKIFLKFLLDNNYIIAYLNVRFGDCYNMNIGQMIEFLGKTLCRIKHEIYNDDEYKLQMEIFNRKWTWIVILYDRTFLHEELCDALWDAVKYKLKQCNKTKQ